MNCSKEITAAFGSLAKDEPELSSMSVREAVRVFWKQNNYEQQDNNFIIHEIMHVLAGATNGLMSDEGRAGIMEMVMLNCKYHQAKLIEGNIYVNQRFADPAEEDIREWCIDIQALAYSSAVNNAKLKDKVKFAKKLSEDEFQEALNRARMVKTYFMEQTGGKKILDFPLPEILDMPISRFGIEAIKVDEKIRFVMIQAPVTSTPYVKMAAVPV